MPLTMHEVAFASAVLRGSRMAMIHDSEMFVWLEHEAKSELDSTAERIAAMLSESKMPDDLEQRVIVSNQFVDAPSRS